MSTMACIYTCTECGANLNLNPGYLFPQDFYFEVWNKGTISFSTIDDTKFRFEKENKIRPFFETLNYWGIQRKRTKIMCNTCARLIGHVYDDGPSLLGGPGQFHMGPSQAIPRASRFRFRTKSSRIISNSDLIWRLEDTHFEGFYSLLSCFYLYILYNFRFFQGETHISCIVEMVLIAAGGGGDWKLSSLKH